jgi:molybdopterin converting factor small subunit
MTTATTSLADIDKQAEKAAAARQTLAALVQALTDSLDATKRDALPAIRRALDRAADQHDKLRQLIADAPELFSRPKSQILHGLKLGYKKSKGKIEFNNPDRVMALIKRHFPEQAKTLIVTEESPSKKALANLTATDLKKLGINVTEGDDVVFITPVDSAVDKMVDALLKDATATE